MPNSLRVNLNFIFQGKLYLSSSSHPIMDPFCQSINTLYMLLSLCLHCLPLSIYIPGLGRSPGEGNATHSVFLPGESHVQRSLAGYSSRGHKEWDRTELLITHNTEEGWPCPLLAGLWSASFPAGPWPHTTHTKSYMNVPVFWPSSFTITSIREMPKLVKKD